MDIKKYTKIFIPVLIVCVIVAMFLIKNRDNALDNSEPTETTGETEATGAATTREFPLNLEKFDLADIQTYGVPTMIDFGSGTCVPCKEMAPILEKLNKELQGKAAVQFINVYDYMSGEQTVPIIVIPAQVFFNADGTPYRPSWELVQEIGFKLYNDDDGQLAFTVHEGGLTEEEILLILGEMGVE